jgi:hypothetical protein
MHIKFMNTSKWQGFLLCTILYFVLKGNAGCIYEQKMTTNGYNSVGVCVDYEFVTYGSSLDISYEWKLKM